MTRSRAAGWINTHFAPQWVSVIDGGGPVTVLSGVHVGCFELFGKGDIRSIADLAAIKRVVRAILKAADLCAGEPVAAAQRLVDGRFAARYDYALQTIRDVPYDKWGSMTPRTRYGSTRSGFMISALSNRCRK
jgi:hypothetical protein